MPKVAVAEGAVPQDVVDGLRDLGYGLWLLPRGEPGETERLIEEFPPDVVILTEGSGTEGVARTARGRLSSLRVLVAAREPAIPSEIPPWADLVIASGADLTFWMLALMAVAPLEGQAARGLGRGRQTLFTIIDAAHRGIRSLEGESRENRVLGDLRARLEKSFELLLRIVLDQLEREFEWYVGHSSRVADLSRRMAASLGLSTEEVEAAGMAGLLHDLGMHLVVPPDAIRRPGTLHRGEWEVIRAHPAASALAISPIAAAEGAAVAIREHHERLDGSGYPLGRRGDDISVIGRAVAVTDVYDALIQPRPHRPAMHPDQAVETVVSEGRAGRLDREMSEILADVLPPERPLLRAIRLQDAKTSPAGSPEGS